jgi:hypothetical protein
LAFLLWHIVGKLIQQEPLTVNNSDEVNDMVHTSPNNMKIMTKRRKEKEYVQATEKKRG